MRPRTSMKKTILFFIPILCACFLSAGSVDAQLLFHVTFGSSQYSPGRWTDRFFAASCSGNYCTASELSIDWSTYQLSKVFRRSNDGGVTWIKQDPGVPYARGENEGSFWIVDQIDSLNVVAIGDTLLILRTFDGGATWVRQTSPDSIRAGYVHFCDPMNGIITGLNIEPEPILTTSDGGAHWNNAPFRAMNVFEGHPFGKGKFALFQSYTNKVFTTNDNWQTVDSTESFCDTCGFQLNAEFSNGSTIIAHGMIYTPTNQLHGVIIRSTDMGRHWDAPHIFDSVPVYPNITCMSDIDRDTILAGCGAVGYSTGLLISTDRGISWYVDSLRFDTTVTYPVTKDICLTPGGNVVGAFWIDLNPDNGVLAQAHFVKAGVNHNSLPPVYSSRIYPNPASESVTITSDGESGTVYLIDLLGREMRRDEIAAHGSLSFNTASLPRGIYSVVVKHDGTLEQVGNLALIGK